jgi:hypothetical protein
MFKLSELLETVYQPGESKKMSDFLKRGTIDQTKIMEPYDGTSTRYSSIKGTIEEEPLTVAHPENTQKVVGWSWDEANTLDGDDNAGMAFSGRDLQILQELKKIIARLLSSGYNMHEIEIAINAYIRAEE